MNTWSAPQRPNAYVEHALIAAMLDGTFPAGSTLPGERTLAEHLGVTRPTLREAIQRLARDGWLTVRQGKATVVNNYWEEGGLNVLTALVQHRRHLPPNFVSQLLEVRLHLAPAYTRAAVENAPSSVEPFLARHTSLEDSPASMAAFDWQLHRRLTIASRNPIYTLILNGFSEFYEEFARLYFLPAEARRRSRAFYRALHNAIREVDAARAEQVSRAAMLESLELWKQARSQGN